MTSDTANLLLKYLVVESGFEFTLSGYLEVISYSFEAKLKNTKQHDDGLKWSLSIHTTGLRDTHCILPTTKNNEVLLGCDCGAVQRSVGNICLHDFEICCVYELGSHISRCAVM